MHSQETAENGMETLQVCANVARGKVHVLADTTLVLCARSYIAIGAPHELNLDILSRKATDLSMITPHVSSFDSAQKRILNLLENDAYRRFLLWDIYQQLVRSEDNDEESETRV